MICSISPSTIGGSISIPPSKSQTLRALLFASFSCGKSVITNPLSSPDVSGAIAACRSLGAEIVENEGKLEIWGRGGALFLPSAQLDVGGSGISFRFLSALTSLFPTRTTIRGDYALSELRPSLSLFEGLSQLGAKVTFHGKRGFAPVTIEGPISPGVVQVEGPDSQPVSALLIAASFLEGETRIEVKNPGEKPWIDLTLSWLDRLGVSYHREGYEVFVVQGKGALEGFSYEVAGDWSSAAFPLITALITRSSLTLGGLDFNDGQGDRALLDHLVAMNASLTALPSEKKLLIAPSELKGVDLSLDGTIDALPALAALACFAEGDTLLGNALSARHKESDRIRAMRIELSKMGAAVYEREEGLLIRKSALKGASLSSHADHRVAMALVAASLGAEGDSQLEGISWIDKTFPHFFAKMQQLGAKLCLIKESISSSAG